MKTFHCTSCQNLVFFENSRCLSCRQQLAYLPDQQEMVAWQQGDDGLWYHQGRAYRACANSVRHQVCNWALGADDAEELCRSCRLTHVIPDLGQDGNREAWYRLEVAKRRMLYGLLAWGLPVARKTAAEPAGLAFEFLSDSRGPNGDSSRVLTGHDNGLITINVAEADDVYREQQRTRQNEPYRTLLGHFRHEIGHYYWDRLIAGSVRQGNFRNLFGDETADYQQALNTHYTNGPPPDWANDFISAYASTHPWEDWAESWAHVMHMIDALETAKSLGVRAAAPHRRTGTGAAGAVGQVRTGPLRTTGRGVAVTHVRAEQLHAGPGPARFVPLRALTPGARQAGVRLRDHQAGSRDILKPRRSAVLDRPPYQYEWVPRRFVGSWPRATDRNRRPTAKRLSPSRWQYTTSASRW